jgi:hypothetical protein
MRRPKLRRFPVSLTDEERASLRAKATAHGVSMAAYARAAIAAKRPGGLPGQPAAFADAWWDQQSPSRRAQVHGWLTAGRGLLTAPDEDQLAMFDAQEGPK